MNNLKRTACTSLAALAAAVGIAGEAAAQQTPIRDLVVYGLQGDKLGGPPGTLFRWVPADGTYQKINDTYNAANGAVLWDQEWLAWIPGGPFAGAYTSCNKDGPGPYKKRLINMSLFDATGQVNAFHMDAYIRGSVAFEDPVGSGNWKIYGARSQGVNGSIVIIDPATGGFTHLADVDDIMEGLALDASGRLFGVSIDEGTSDSWLWEISRTPGVGTPWPHKVIAGADRMESLEFAFGDKVPAFSGMPAGTAGWAPGAFANGTLMGFADDLNALYIINPLTGEGVPLDAIEGKPITVPWEDVEGLVFLTKLRDPMSAIFHGWD